MQPTKNINPLYQYNGPNIDILDVIKDGDLKKVRLLVGSHNIQSEDEDGNTPLHWAVHEGYIDIVKYLVSIGADIHATNKNMYTSFAGACYLNDLVMVEYLFSLGSNIEVRDCDEYTPLIGSCQFDNIEIVQFLVSHGANIEARDDTGATPLIMAICSDQLKIVKYLIDCEANMFVVDELGKTAFFWVHEVEK